MEKDGTIVITQHTKQKVDAAKFYIERRYSKLIQQEREKKQNWELLNKLLMQLNLSPKDIDTVKASLLHKEAVSLRLNRKKISVANFDCVKVIGRGAFGEVRLCRNKETGDPVAIKVLRKSEMIEKRKVTQVWQEREAMASAMCSKWMVKLHCSFQDQKNLYLVMEYLSGGDLMNLLIKKDIFTEDEARFYIAEIILALEEFHKMKYIHRDLKPDNILLDSEGHIKLSDFGLCKYFQQRMGKRAQKTEKFELKKIDTFSLSKDLKEKRRKMAFTAVGTPDYVAPQVQSGLGYTETVDWWSVGVILYEMLVGYTPFMSEDYSSTCYKILNWRKTLMIPKERNLSLNAIDLIRRLINDQKERLGLGGVDEIKNHPFFAEVNWKNIRQIKSPNIPSIDDPFDSKYFDNFELMEPWKEDAGRKYLKDPQFIGYTFKNLKTDFESQLLKALLDLEMKSTVSDQCPNSNIQALQLQVNFSKKGHQFIPIGISSNKTEKMILKMPPWKPQSEKKKKIQ